MKLVGSILPTDILIERISEDGPKLLRKYIEYAINGPEVLEQETSAENDEWFDSPFEESVSLISYCLRNGLSANFTETLDMLRFYHKIVTYESRERRFKLPETRS